jgi:hypothetical protein
MSEAVRSAWASAVALTLAEHASALAGDVLDVGGGAESFGRSLPDATLTVAGAPATGSRDIPDDALDAIVPASFDGAVCVGALAFAGEPGRLIASTAAALRPEAAFLAVAPCGFAEELSGALHAFTLRGLHEMFSAAGFEVEFVRGFNPAGGGALSRELAAFTHQSPRSLNLPSELTGWVDVMDEQRPLLLACLGRKPGTR